MNAIAPVDIGKLAKLCGLFSSDQMGERAAAAAKADAMVRAAGLTWPDVLTPKMDDAVHFEASRRHENLTPGMILAQFGDRLTGWEKGFLTSIIRRPHLSARQCEVLDEIRARFP